jgi:uncharacterized protein YhaN
MRLRRLDLLRYGHLTDVPLDFPPDAPLVVVLGANEAGKSTALAAIGDALFGFPHSSPFAFLHDTAQLRLGFEIAGQDGTRASFIRRKGRRDTLLDADGNPLPEAALLRLLGGASRDVFETTYGLNGVRLRDGAQSLLESGGEAGESLLAGMGLPHLRKALERLDREAKALHGDGKGRRALAVATEAWRQKDAAAAEAAVRPRDWLAAEAALQAIQDEVATATGQAGALTTEAARLNRVRRVLGRLTTLSARRAELAQVADAPALPGDAAATFQRLCDAERQAAEDQRRETEAARQLEAKRAALPLDPAVTALQDEVEALVETRPGIVQAERDLPAVERQVADYRAEVAEAAAQLGTAATAEAVRDALPKQADRQQAQGLTLRRTKLATDLAAAERVRGKAEWERDEAARGLAEAIPPPPAAPLRHAIDAAQDEGPLDRDLAAAERARAAAARKLAAALAALPLWTGDAAALAACPLPLPPAEAAAAQRLAAAEAAQSAARAAEATLAAEIAALERDVAHLARGETVPTPAVIAAERARRDAVWDRLRAALEAGAAADPATLPDEFETLRDTADRLADARADDAQRVTDFATKSADLVVLRDQWQRGQNTAANDAVAAAQTAWTALWSPAAITPQAPAAMAEWRRAREEVLRLAALEEEAAAKWQDLASRHATARQALTRLLPEAAPDATLAALLAQAKEALARMQAAEAAHQKRLADAATAAGRLTAASTTRAEAAEALAALDPEWRAATAALNLPPDAAPETVDAALAAWAKVAEAAKAWRGDAARVADMRAAIDGFASATGAVLARLGLPVDEVASLAVARLSRRLKAAQAAATDADALARHAKERQAAAAEAARLREDSGRAIAALRDAAGAVDLPALEQAIQRAARRDALRAEIATLGTELLREGDGHDEAALRAEAEGIDPDQAAARLADIDATQATLRDRLTRLGAARQQAETTLQGMQAGRDAAGLAQEARHHLAEAQQAAERYARLHVARSLLQAGIERIRQERQGPLLRAAGGHFAALTEGRYVSLTADEDDAGRTILRAVRDDRSECPVEALSEGTRDQLYLALRIAAVEAHAQAGEPLPFIADDLLATFDDRRAAAAIALLARLGGTLQTILFTHHAHLASLAARQPGIVIRELPGGSGRQAA